MTLRTGIIALVLLAGCKERINVVKTGLEGKQIPSFEMLLVDSTTNFSTDKIASGKPSVFLFFGPDCPHCKAEVQTLTKNMKDLKDINFYFVTPYAFKKMKAFYKNYELGNYGNVMTGMDYANFFGDYYKVKAIPYIAIYNKDRIFQKAVQGDISSEKIRDLAFQ